MIIVLGANVLIADPLLGGHRFEALCSHAKRRAEKIIVPQVAFMEAVRRYGDLAEEALKAINKASSYTRRMGVGKEFDFGRLRKAVQDAPAQYEDRLRERLHECDVEINDVPKVDHAAIIDRIMEGRKPASSKSDNYRDVLIWHTLLEVVGESNEHVAFVSTNWKDFGIAESSTALADDLKGDLDGIGKPESVTLYNGLKMFLGERR